MEDPLDALQARLTEAERKIEELVNKIAAGIGAPPPPSLPKRPPLFGGKRERVRIRDTKTGVIYDSKSAVGRTLAHEVGATPQDRFAWYKLISKFPGRFIEVL